MEAVQGCGRNIVIRAKIAEWQPLTTFGTMSKSFSFSMCQTHLLLNGANVL